MKAYGIVLYAAEYTPPRALFGVFRINGGRFYPVTALCVASYCVNALNPPFPGRSNVVLPHQTVYNWYWSVDCLLITSHFENKASSNAGSTRCGYPMVLREYMLTTQSEDNVIVGPRHCYYPGPKQIMGKMGVMIHLRTCESTGTPN